MDSKEQQNDNATRLEKPAALPAIDFKADGQRGASNLSRPRRARMFTSGSLRWSGASIRSKEDVASLLSHIRKSPQEFLYSVAVDKNGDVIEIIHKYTKGVANISSADPVEISGRCVLISRRDSAIIKSEENKNDLHNTEKRSEAESRPSSIQEKRLRESFARAGWKNTDSRRYLKPETSDHEALQKIGKIFNQWIRSFFRLSNIFPGKLHEHLIFFGSQR